MRKITLTFLLSLITGFIMAQTPTFWGMTNLGGTDGGGVIFRTDSVGSNQKVVYSFPVKYIGKFPYSRLCLATNGKLYGMTRNGGKYDKGVIFEYDPLTNIYTKKIDFDGTSKGSEPYGSLIQTTNGKLYGMTTHGGQYNTGVLFEYNLTTNTFSKKTDFDGASKGSYPFGSLIQTTNGKLYGLTSSGGQYDKGVLFEYNLTTNTFSKKVDFDGTNGNCPKGSLIQASNGKLYGMTDIGGQNYYGDLFEYDPVLDTLIKKVEFDKFFIGSRPNGSLMQASNGKLYGTTNQGGLFNMGVLFEYNIATDTLISKVDFDGTNKGGSPNGSLIQFTNGKLYGLTSLGGLLNKGVLFEYDPASNIYTKKIEFDGTNKGSYPYESLMQTSNDIIYGMTSLGGIGGQKEGQGVLFEYSPLTNSFTKKIDFNFGILGNFPAASLLNASNGKLYGMTHAGGQYGKGVIFEYDPTSYTYTKKIEFDGTNKGSYPYGSLIEATNGKLYGMTYNGGQYDYGVIFEFDPLTNAYAKIIDFDGANNGISPFGSIFQASNGKLYGMAQYGGQNGCGVLFELNPVTSSFTKLIDFDGTNKGKHPKGSLMQASNGKLYGMTREGGQYGSGVIFEYNVSTNTFSKKNDFDNTGSFPEGSLLQASNGKLYGMTTEGPVYTGGVLFEFDLSTNMITKKVYFDSTNADGIWPRGSLIETSNGKLYGMTQYNGIYNMQGAYGVIFEYDIASDSLIKKSGFNSLNGAHPYGDLIIVNINTIGFTTTTKDDNIKVSISPNPNNGSFTLSIDNSNAKLNETYFIEIYDVLGNFLHSEEIKGGNLVTTNIQMKSLSKGMYFLSLKTKDNLLTTRFMVQ